VLPLRFEGRVLSIDLAVAHACGKIVARCEALGRPLSAADGLIAATAEIHGLTLVTRNASNFEPTSKAVVNPWAEG
jgi:toxin FitB